MKSFIIFLVVLFEYEYLYLLLYIFIGMFLLRISFSKHLSKYINSTDTGQIIKMVNTFLESDLGVTECSESEEQKIIRTTMFNIHFSKILKSLRNCEKRFVVSILVVLGYFISVMFWPIVIPLAYISFYSYRYLFINFLYQFHELNKTYVYGMRKDFKEIAERQKEMVKENNSENI